MLFLLIDSRHKLKLEKLHDALIILFYISPSSRQLQRLFFINYVLFSLFFLISFFIIYFSLLYWWKDTKTTTYKLPYPYIYRRNL